MNHLAQLLAEIVHDIHKLLDPRGLFVVPTTCRYLYDFIKDNQILHKDNYYRVLVWSPLIWPLRGKESVVPTRATSTTHAQDEPPTTNLDWVREIHDVLASKPSAPATEALSLTLPPPSSKRDGLDFVCTTVTRLLHRHPPTSKRLPAHRPDRPICSSVGKRSC